MIATGCGVIAAFAGVRVSRRGFKEQNKSYKESLSLELVMKLDDRFLSERFVKIRSDAAQALLAQQSEDPVQAEEVFDFFETIGTFVKRDSLDADLAYNFFFHWINLYWNAGKDYILKKRKGSGALWSDFEFLYSEVLKVEKQKDPKSLDITPSQQRIEEQLQEEIQN